MNTRSFAALAVFMVFGSIGASAAREPLSKADVVIAAAKRATGGTRWDRAAGCHEEGTRGGGITYTTRFSLEKYGMRVDSRRGENVRSMGFDGKTRWQAMSGKTQIRNDAGSIREATLTNYLSINGFFFPHRFPATIVYVREASEAGRKFDILAITPQGARTLEVWFDHRTHLVQRVVDQQGVPPVTVEASANRRVGGFVIATKLRVSGFDGTLVDTGNVTSFRCGPIEGGIFDPPSAR